MSNTVEQENKITVLVVEPERAPYVKTIDCGLKSLQAEVGGYIEVVYPFEDLVGLILDEEGKLCGKPLNRALRSEDGEIYDILAGTFLVAGLTEDNFGSLSDELIQKYTEHFKNPEMFFRVSGKIMAIPFEPEERMGEKANDSKPEMTSLNDQIQSAENRAPNPGTARDGLSQNLSEPEF